MNRLLLVVVTLFMFAGCHHSVQANLPSLTNGAAIERIQIAGNRAIPTDVILAKIQTKAGDRIDRASIQRDIRNVRSLGFVDVHVEEDNGTGGGKIITFSVRERTS